MITVDLAKNRTSFINEGFASDALFSFVITVAFILYSRRYVICGQFCAVV